MYRHRSIIYIEKLLFFQSFLFYEIDSFWQLKRSKFCWDTYSHLLSKSSCQLSKIFQVKNFSLFTRSVWVLRPRIQLPEQNISVITWEQSRDSDWMWTVKFWFENYFKNKQKKYSAYKHTDWAAFILDWITTIEFTFFLIRFWLEIDKWFEPGRSLNVFRCFIYILKFLFAQYAILHYDIFHQSYFLLKSLKCNIESCQG